MVKANFIERRNSIRAKRILSIEFRLLRTKRKIVDKSWHLSTTEDMSIGGLSFYSDVELRSGELLEIRVVMSGILDIFNGLAQITRVGNKGTAAYYLVAVKFLERKTYKRRQAKTFYPRKKVIAKI